MRTTIRSVQNLVGTSVRDWQVPANCCSKAIINQRQYYVILLLFGYCQ